ncbi:hypothetical protein GQ42DRAFT_30072 [Ramicandelaber brevisporus]|nr:hypothetical protein GQ42DRAFT_30072 [Ramicandelaber brevisporus]
MATWFASLLLTDRFMTLLTSESLYQMSCISGSNFESDYYRDINYQQFATLRNLRAVKGSREYSMPSLPHGFIEWLNNESQSGQVETVSMIASSVIGQVIPSIMRKVRNLHRLRLHAVYSLQDVMKPDHWAQSSVGYTEIEILSGREDHCLSSHLGPLLGHQHGVYIPHLTRLSIPVCCLHQATQEFAALIPANFPALTDLGLSLCSRECNRSPGQILLRIFKSDWSQLIGLSITDRFSSEELDFALSATPNVRILNCCMDKYPLDLEVIRSRLLRLVDLNLPSSKIIYSQPKQVSIATSRIRSVSVQFTVISIDLLRFIFTASPCLRALSINNCQIQEDVARYGVRQAAKTPLVNLDVVAFSAAADEPFSEHMITLIQAFASATKLHVSTGPAQKEEIYARYPHIKFA